MYYQYDHDYNFNSDKFEKAFNFKPTAYRDGIKLLSETFIRNNCVFLLQAPGLAYDIKFTTFLIPAFSLAY